MTPSWLMIHWPSLTPCWNFPSLSCHDPLPTSLWCKCRLKGYVESLSGHHKPGQSQRLNETNGRGSRDIRKFPKGWASSSPNVSRKESSLEIHISAKMRYCTGATVFVPCFNTIFNMLWFTTLGTIMNHEGKFKIYLSGTLQVTRTDKTIYRSVTKITSTRSAPSGCNSFSGKALQRHTSLTIRPPQSNFWP